MTNYVLALGRGFDDAGRPLLAVAEAEIDERAGWTSPARGVVTDLVIAAEAVPADPEPTEFSLGIRLKSKETDPVAAEAIRKASAEGSWILLVGARGMPDGDEGIRVVAPVAFVPKEEFDPLTSRHLARLCETEIARHFHKAPPEEDLFHIGPMCPDVLWHHVEQERAKQEPHEAIIWVRSDGLAICVSHRGSYLLYSTDNGPECRDCGFNGSQLPDAPGFYFFSGTPWAHHGSPANDFEYDDGIDGTFEPLRDDHLERFGVTWEILKEEIREYEEELEAEGIFPASSASA